MPRCEQARRHNARTTRAPHSLYHDLWPATCTAAALRSTTLRIANSREDQLTALCCTNKVAREAKEAFQVLAWLGGNVAGECTPGRQQVSTAARWTSSLAPSPLPPAAAAHARRTQAFGPGHVRHHCARPRAAGDGAPRRPLSRSFGARSQSGDGVRVERVTRADSLLRDCETFITACTGLRVQVTKNPFRPTASATHPACCTTRTLGQSAASHAITGRPSRD